MQRCITKAGSIAILYVSLLGRISRQVEEETLAERSYGERSILWKEGVVDEQLAKCNRWEIGAEVV